MDEIEEDPIEQCYCQDCNKPTFKSRGGATTAHHGKERRNEKGEVVAKSVLIQHKDSCTSKTVCPECFDKYEME